MYKPVQVGPQQMSPPTWGPDSWPSVWSIQHIGTMHVEVWGPCWAGPALHWPWHGWLSFLWESLHPHHHSREMASAQLWENWPHCHRRAGSAPKWGLSQWPRLSSSATTETYILGLGLAHPNIYPIYDLLQHIEGLVLQNVSHTISMIWGNKRMFRL